MSMGMSMRNRGLLFLAFFNHEKPSDEHLLGDIAGSVGEEKLNISELSSLQVPQIHPSQLFLPNSQGEKEYAIQSLIVGHLDSVPFSNLEPELHNVTDIADISV